GTPARSGPGNPQSRFRRDRAPGAEIGVLTPGGRDRRYVVTGSRVVREDDTTVLDDDGWPRLTLVTCFPFDAVVPGGPLRYVVDAAGLESPRSPPSRRWGSSAWRWAATSAGTSP